MEYNIILIIPKEDEPFMREKFKDDVIRVKEIFGNDKCLEVVIKNKEEYIIFIKENYRWRWIWSFIR